MRDLPKKRARLAGCIGHEAAFENRADDAGIDAFYESLLLFSGTAGEPVYSDASDKEEQAALELLSRIRMLDTRREKQAEYAINQARLLASLKREGEARAYLDEALEKEKEADFNPSWRRGVLFATAGDLLSERYQEPEKGR